MDKDVDLEVLWRNDKLNRLSSAATLELYLVLLRQNVLLCDDLGVLFLFDLHNSADGLHNDNKDGDAGSIEAAVQQQVVVDLSASVCQLQHEREDSTQ